MSIRIKLKCFETLLTLFLAVALIIQISVPAYAKDEGNVILDVPWTLINNCGNQYEPGGHSLACQAYSIAYCRIILDNKAHKWTDYRASGSPYLAVVFSVANYNNEHSTSKEAVLKTVYSNINNGRPVILNVVSAKTTGHYVVAIGYKSSCDPNNIKESDIIILNPSNNNITSTAGSSATYSYLGPTYSLKCNTNNKNQYQYGTAKSGGVKVINGSSTVNSVNNGSTVNNSATYADCNVEIACVNGQTVNLYNNPGDTSRVTYFNKGQIARSTYLAKLSDGTTWYRVGAVHNGTDRIFWLKYESSKMKVTPISTQTQYTVTFNAAGGSVSPSSTKVTNGSTYGSLPTPTRGGYNFDGWYTSQSGGSRITGSTSVSLTGNQTLYAHWTENTKYTITFDATGGSVSPSSKTYSSGSLIGTLPIPTRKGYTFLFWSTAYMRSGMVVSPDNYTVTEDATLYAVWRADETEKVDDIPSSQGYTVTFDAIGFGLLKYTKTVTNGSTYGTLPTPPTVDGYTFDGWYTAKSGGTKITESTKVNLSGDQKLYAHWVADSDPNPTEPTWTAWSEWSTTRVSSSPTRRIESREVEVTPARTEYRYGRYVDSTGTHDCWCAKYLEGLSYISGKASLQYSEWSTTQYGTSGKNWTCGNCNGNHIGVDHTTSDGRSWWHEYLLPNGEYYWKETRQVDATYEIQYRYSDLISG